MKTRTKRMLLRPLCLFLALLMVTSTMLIIPILGLGSSAAGTVEAKNPQVEYMTTPLGIDAVKPHFSYYLESTGDLRGVLQTSYKIVVSAKSDYSAPVWDSGEVTSTSTFGIEYGGTALAASTRYYWKVTSKTNKGEATVSSWFETGLMSESVSAWDGATWITAPSKDSTAAPDIGNYTIDWDFKIVKHGATLRFASDTSGTYHLDWQFNTYNSGASGDNPGGIPALRPHVWNTGGAALGFIKVDGVVTKNATDGTDDFYTCRIVVTKSGSTYKASTYIKKQGASSFTTVETDRTLPAGHAWDLGTIGFRQNQGGSNKEDALFDNIYIYDNTTTAGATEGNRIYAETFSGSTVPSLFGTNGKIENGAYRLGDGKSEEFSGNQRIVDLGTPEVGEPLLRKSFNLTKAVKSARLYATARGYYEMRLNGAKVGDSYLNPGWTDYEYTLMYQTYDVTSMLKSGENVIGGMIAQGWYSGPYQRHTDPMYGSTQSLLAYLIVTYEDGSTEKIKTDNTWSYHGGPIMYADNYAGEYYDANYDCKGWDNTGYNTTGWTSAVVAGALKNGVKLVTQTGEAIKNVQTFKNPTLTVPVAGRYTYDFGQNFAGVVKITVKGEAGQKITLSHAEMLNTANANNTKGGGDGPIGTIYRGTLRDQFSRGRKVAVDTYTLKGDPNGETWEARFTFHGFRYVEIQGITSASQIVSIEGIALSSANELTSTFESSNAKLNQLFSNIIWGMRSNFVSVPTDCPNRDERLGYTGDTQIFAGTGVYFAQADQFYAKWLRDLRDYQMDTSSLGSKLNGLVPVLIPAVRDNGTFEQFGNGWSDAAIIVPYQLYAQYGDIQILRDAWASMKAYYTFITDSTRSPNGLRSATSTSWEWQLGDWVAIEGSDTQLVNSLYLAYDELLMWEIASVLGESTATYKSKLNKTLDEIYAKWGDKNGSLKVTTQTPLAMLLYFGLAEKNESYDPIKIAAQLAKNVQDHGWKLTTGFLGVNALLPALARYGQTYTAMKLLEQEDYPSWIYSVNQGATTCWERWNSYTVENGFDTSGMNSFNHYAYGAVGEFMMGGVLGIERDNSKGNVGFHHFNLNPQFGASMTSAKGSYKSVSGLISSDWTYDVATGKFTYKITVPANTTATLYMPTSGGVITESGKAANTAEGVTYDKTENGRAIYNLTSGTYTFVSTVEDSATSHDVKLTRTSTAGALADAWASGTAYIGTDVIKGSSIVTIPTGKAFSLNIAAANPYDFYVTGVTDSKGVNVPTSMAMKKLVSDLEYKITMEKIAHTNVLAGKTPTATNSHQSGTSGAWVAANLTDGILGSRGDSNGWTSTASGTSAASATLSTPTTVTFNAGSGQTFTFNRLLLYPRTNAVSSTGGVAGFPDSFKIQTSTNGTSWTDAKTLTGVTTDMYSPYCVDFDEPITTQYLRISVSKYGPHAADDTAGYRLQLAEIAAYNMANINITTSSLSSATEYSAYSATLASGTTDAKWQVTGGRLPSGLSLNPSTGVITGTPTEDGTFNLTVTAIAPNAAGSKALTLTVAYADNPNPDETTAPDSSQTTPEPDVSVTTPDSTAGGGTTAPATTAPTTTTPTTDKPSGGGCGKKKNSDSATVGNSLIAFSPFVLMLGGFVTFRQVRKSKKSDKTNDTDSNE